MGLKFDSLVSRKVGESERNSHGGRAYIYEERALAVNGCSHVVKVISLRHGKSDKLETACAA